MNVTGKRVLITGGSRGLGLALAQVLSAQGAKVAISGRRPEGVAEAVRERSGVPVYRGLPTVGAGPDFIGGLAALVRRAGTGLQSGEGGRLCPAGFPGCAFRR